MYDWTCIEINKQQNLNNFKEHLIPSLSQLNYRLTHHTPCKNECK